MSRALWSVALGAWLLVACDDALLATFEPQPLLEFGGGAPTGGSGGEGGGEVGGQAGGEVGGQADGEVGGQPGGEVGGQAGGGYGGTQSAGGLGGGGPAALTAPLIDDFEDGDPRAEIPRGWWYPVNDKTSAQGFGIEPVSPGNASAYALRTHGSGFQDWGAAVGVDLVGDATPNDASRYTKLCFLARVESGSVTAMHVHLLRGGQHYVQDVSLSETWTTYCLPLVGFIGDDNTPLVANELIALQFFFDPKSDFATWLDDVQFEP